MGREAVGHREAESVPTLSRRLFDLRRIASNLKRSRMTPLQVCEAIIEDRVADREARSFFSHLPSEELHYWVASLYTLLMPPARRRKLAAYFTPPYLADHAIDALVSAGVTLGRDRILDPASGGAAFLVPIAARIAAHGSASGESSSATIAKINSTLYGIEIDSGLADLSQLLLRDLLSLEAQLSKTELAVSIECGNTLRLDRAEGAYDAVICNPPYGRILQPSRALKQKFKNVITEGYVNLYALFIERALRWVRPGGAIALIVPVSFIGGPNFAALRKHILESASVVRLDLVDKRSDVFLDVMYDLCVLVLKRTTTEVVPSSPKTSVLALNKPPVELGMVQIPSTIPSDIWALPNGKDSDPLFVPGLATLADYGFVTKTGYFVWNREKTRYRSGLQSRRGEVPLIWAHNVRANEKCLPKEVGSQKIGFVKVATSSSYIIRSPAIVLQRTTNRRQARRLVAGLASPKAMSARNGFVTENHTIVILRDPSKKVKVSLRTLCRLLNTTAVDGRFRRMSGSVSVSTKALRSLPLPKPELVRALFAGTSDDEAAAAAAYADSVAATPSDAASSATSQRRRK